jgi:hypothetical protein
VRARWKPIGTERHAPIESSVCGTLAAGGMSLDFEVRGVNPENSSIQFPITYLAATGSKQRVVHAKGPHVLKLSEALEKFAVKNGVISKGNSGKGEGKTVGESCFVSEWI